MLLLLNVNEECPLSLVMSFRQLVLERDVVGRLLNGWVCNLCVIMELSMQIVELEGEWRRERALVERMESENERRMSVSRDVMNEME